jgi:hypothetical protein
MASTQVIPISSREDALAALAAASRRSIRERFPEVRVALPGVAADKSLKSQLRLNQAAVDCGCATGSAFMTAAALFCVALLWVSSGSPLGADWTARAVAVGFVLAAAAVGKVVGLLKARRRLIDELAALTTLTEQPAEERS